MTPSIAEVFHGSIRDPLLDTAPSSRVIVDLADAPCRWPRPGRRRRARAGSDAAHPGRASRPPWKANKRCPVPSSVPARCALRKIPAMPGQAANSRSAQASPRACPTPPRPRVPLLPGVSTASEVTGQRRRLTASQILTGRGRGQNLLKALSGPFPDGFCPPAAHHWRRRRSFGLPSVRVCGGSWLTPQDAVDAKDWSRIPTPRGSALRGSNRLRA